MRREVPESLMYLATQLLPTHTQTPGLCPDSNNLVSNILPTRPRVSKTFALFQPLEVLVQPGVLLLPALVRPPALQPPQHTRDRDIRQRELAVDQELGAIRLIDESSESL